MKAKMLFAAAALTGLLAVSGNDNIKLPDTVLPIQKQANSATVKFPALKKIDGKIPVLKSRIFYEMKQTMGWNNDVSLILNGKQLSRFTATGEERLLRRGTAMMLKKSRRNWWSNTAGLLVFFGPGEGEVDRRIKSPREEGYWYYMDISDFVNYIELGLDDRVEKALENNLQLQCLMTKRTSGGMNSPLTFKDCEIIYMDKNEAAKLRPAQQLVKINPAPVVAEINNGKFNASVTASGGLILERNGEKYFYSGAYSYPSKNKMKFDSFSAEVSKNRKNMQIKVSKKDGNIIISAETPDRRIIRTLQFKGDLLYITDAVTNLGKEDMGVYSYFNVVAPEAIKPDNLYFGGMQGVNSETGCGSNPTLYIRGAKSGFGAMAYDDAFRCHLELAKVAANSADLRNPAGIKAGETYVQKQFVMLTDRNDYFEFINTLRRDLDLNRTLEGPIGLGVREVTKGIQLRISTFSEWFEYGIKTIRMPREKYKQLYHENREKQRKLFPNIKTLAQLEMSPHFVDTTNFKNAHLLPSRPNRPRGKYGEILSKEATEVIDKNTPFSDSILRTADGRAIVDMYYGNGNNNTFSLLVYAYNNNAYEKRITEQVKYLIKEAGVDGIYIDQFANGTMFPMTSAQDRTSYDRWDGRSVVLNPDGTIKMKVFDIGYASAPSRARIIRHILDRGKILVANTQPVTTTEAEAGGFRFYETDCENLGPMLFSTEKPSTFRHQAFAQLSPSPLLLGTRPAMFTDDNKNYAKMYNRAFICGLRHGLLYLHYGWSTAASCYNLVNYMFPLTPVELGEGFIIGKERVVTAISRKFTTDVKPHTIVAFDAEGKKLDAAKVAAVKDLQNGKYEIDVKLNDWNSSCVIVLHGFASPADENKQLEADKKKVHKRSGKYPKVLTGPTRSCKYPDAQAEDIGNVYRFFTGNGQGVWDRIKECIKSRTPFVFNEIVPRNPKRLNGPAEKLYDGYFNLAEVKDLLAEAGELYLGRSILGEYGGMVYWPEGSLRTVYGKLPPADDLVQARKNYHDRLEKYAAKERFHGVGPLRGICSSMSYPPLNSKAFDVFDLEMMPGDPERLLAALRGANRAYGKKNFGTLIAFGFYGGATWDELYFKRFANALNYAYMAGCSNIFSESGHFGWPYYGHNIRREDPLCIRFRDIMRKFKEFCEVDERPADGPETPMAFMQGNLDGYPGLWANHVWGQFSPEFAVGEAEQGWKLTEAVYQKNPWFDHNNIGMTDNSGQVPCGMYDIVPADIPEDKLNRYKLLVIPGWNTMTDDLYDKLCKFVENGGTLIMSLAQMRTNIKRNESIKLYNNGDFSRLFGIKISGIAPVDISGIKFPSNNSANGRYKWVNWGLSSDGKFCGNGTYRGGNITENNAAVLAFNSTNFNARKDKKSEQIPVLLEHKLGKGYAIFLNSEKFPGHPAMFDIMRYVLNTVMRGEQPADLNITHSDNIRYAVYGKSIYVTNTDSDFDGFFVINNKKYQIKPQQMLHIER